MMNLLERLSNNLTKRPGLAKFPQLDNLDQPFLDLLGSLYRGEPQTGLDGLRHEIKPIEGISPEQGMWIYDLCRKAQPKATLEIGMAYGFSTLYFLAACAGRAVHTAIDPLQLTQYHGIAMSNANKTGAQVDLIPDWSFKALAKLVESDRRFDVIFIDGGHRFDEVLTDFGLSAAVCNPGGYILLDDNWMPSVKTAVAYVTENRPEFDPVPSPILRMAAFRKIGEDTREWNHFNPFPVARRAAGA